MSDFSGLFAGLSVSPAVAAIIAAGSIVVVARFASWLVNTVASFFDDDDGEPEGEAEDYEVSGICYECGDELGGDGYCNRCDSEN